LDRGAATEKAVGLVRTLRRAYEKATKAEIDLFGRVLYADAQWEWSQGRNDRALAALREAYDGGFDPFGQVEKDASLASLRSSAGYQALLQAIDDANLAKARGRVRGHLDRPPPGSFAFTLPDLDGKPVSLSQFRGKVVLIDIWGTWCKPCRDAIPGLIQLYRKNHRRGFEIVGIDYEKEVPDLATAVQMVKRFVQEAGIPYPCVMGDSATLEKIPNFSGFPTSMVIDRTGKVRLLVTQNSGGTMDMLDDTVTVLLAEPPTQAGGTDKAAKPR